MPVRYGSLLDGGDAFAADLAVAATRILFVRSTTSCATIDGVDVSAAVTAPGVLLVLTAADVDAKPIPPIVGGPAHARPLLARDAVRFVGEPIAAIVAESLAAATDAADLVEVTYGGRSDSHLGAAVLETGGETPLTPPAATAPDPAPIVVRSHLTAPRVAVAPMEGHSAVAVPAGDGVVVHLSTQAPHLARQQLAAALGLDAETVRVVVPRVGGGFGGKAGGCTVEHIVTAFAARRLGRSVRWVELRGENLVSMQGRDARLEGVLHADGRGVVHRLAVDATVDAGAYPSIGAIEPGKMRLMAAGAYRIPDVRFTGRSLLSARSPSGAYRGPGRAEAAALVERGIEALGKRLGLDPFEIRRRNVIAAGEFPYTTPTGMTYDSGDYRALLDRLQAVAGYGALRAGQQVRDLRRDRVRTGIGIALVVDSTAWAARAEGVRVAIERGGTVVVYAATASAGQEHAMTYAHLVAEVLPVPARDVVVREGDTADLAAGGGSSGSRSAQLAGAAVHRAATEIDAAARRVAADRLEAALADVVAFPGGYGVRGVPGSVLSLAALAALAAPAAETAGGGTGGLCADARYEQAEPTHPAAAHLSVVGVDLETGRVVPIRHVAVTDAGRILDPPSAHGQVVGATVQGIGQALYEEFGYDPDGTPRSVTLADYLVPSAAEVCPIESVFIESRSPMNALGAKGIGEIGMVAAPIAVHHAVLDALAPFGVDDVERPCSPERVWRALRAAHRGGRTERLVGRDLPNDR